MRLQRNLEEDSEDEGEDNFEDDFEVVVNAKTESVLEWVDRFILETQRKGGCQTETSVLNQ